MEPTLPIPEVTPIFDLGDIYNKLYEAKGKKEGFFLTSEEVAELFDYLDYVSYLDSMARVKKIK